MQNYIKKARKFIFHIFFLRKTNQNHVSPFSTFISTKRIKNSIRRNLLSESEQVSLDLRAFWFVLFANFDYSKPRKWLYVFYTCFSLFFKWTWSYVVLLCLVAGVSPSNFGRW